MQQQIRICEEKQSELLVRQAFERRLADFILVNQDAEFLYRNEKWKEAKSRYGELINLYETGFPGEPTEYRRRQLECEQGIQEQERIAMEEKQKMNSYQNQLNDALNYMKKRSYYKALESAKTAAAILPDSEEAISLIKEAQAGILRLPEEIRIARKKNIIIASVVLFSIIIIYYKIQKEQTDRAFQHALNTNTLIGWRRFINDYPYVSYSQRARDSISVIDSKIKKMEESAAKWLQDVNNPDYISNRRTFKKYARKELENILALDSTNAFANENLKKLLTK
jgi:hypothetical protein